MSSEFQPWQIAATIQLFGFGMTQTECFTNVVKGKLLRARTLSEEFLVCSSNTGNPSVENYPTTGRKPADGAQWRHKCWKYFVVVEPCSKGKFCIAANIRLAKAMHDNHPSCVPTAIYTSLKGTSCCNASRRWICLKVLSQCERPLSPAQTTSLTALAQWLNGFRTRLKKYLVFKSCFNRSKII